MNAVSAGGFDVRSLLSFRSVSFRYRGAVESALTDVSFDLAPGELAAVVGGNGAGKTTLWLAATGTIGSYGGKLDGTILVRGVEQNSLGIADLASTISAVPEEPDRLFCDLTVKGELAFAPENLLFTPNQMRAAIDREARRHGIHELLSRRTTELSGGERQRLALAAAMVTDPMLLFLDEPSLSIDPSSRRELLRHLRSLTASEKCVLFTSVVWDEWVSESDKVLLLDAGRVAAFGTPSEVIEIACQDRLRRVLRLPAPTQLSVEIRSQKQGNWPLSLSTIQLASEKVVLDDPVVGSDVLQDSHGAPAVQLRDVSFSYRPGKPVLDGVDAMVPSSSLTAIVGENGAGKTTLGKIIAGLLRPDTGELRLRGHVVNPPAPGNVYRGCAYVFQSPSCQFITDSVLDEVQLGLILSGTEQKHSIEMARDILAAIGCSHLEGVHPLRLRPVEQRLIALASVMVLKPKVLVLDEPTHGQDLESVGRIVLLLDTAVTDGTAVVVITHDLDFVHSYAKLVHVLHDGRLEFSGSSSDMCRDQWLLQRASLVEPSLVTLTKNLSQGQWRTRDYPRAIAQLLPHLRI